MSLLSSFIIAVHFFLLVILCLFGLHRLSMVVRWFKYRTFKPETPKVFKELPKITVQIPLYNEVLVAQRIVDSIVLLEYPKDKLQIQIVDDSTDDTSRVIAERVDFFQQQGINIQHVQRTNRHGFKAGALKEAMDSATGEFIAIFDADFIPTPNTLLKSINHFTQPDIAMVQFRWEHLNRRSSLLTKIQAIMLDAHFGLEQHVRCASNMLFNFNGTAGIWRTTAIIDAGHWSADTLTEDLDLSYRAQLAGWKMLYLNDLTCPGELPADMNAFKSQQFRWAKGGVEVMMKMLPTVWKSKLPVTKKIESSFHLANNLAYFIMLIDTLIFLVPSLYLRDQYDFLNIWWVDIPLLLLSSGGHLAYLYFGQHVLGRSRSRAFIKLPSLMMLGIQLAINNSKAGVEGLFGKKTEFVRTPKTGELEQGSEPSRNSNSNKQTYRAIPPKGALFEIAIAVIYSIVFLWAVTHQHWFMLPFLFILTLGFVVSAFHSFYSHYQLSK
ncbi:glycosyltransferase [Parashewanella spongiae]|uniref:Glycosyltransferase n=1 Tax=Parashewanella spongiae TaxID=342950 RepID=A0A3A6UKH1_9GAMM|nr:glycosyltransferase [Parashewanella spongiae]MCL1077735.1 glycosyltransferase [Parashewanella spongiae]RJY18063.1 glycosyltransferase [Parashewanella spongiae]